MSDQEWYRLEFRSKPKFREMSDIAPWWAEWQERGIGLEGRPGPEFLTREEVLKAISEIREDSSMEFRAYKIILKPIKHWEI